jgi:uncharacterized protein (DUF2147 family)
MRQKIMPFPFLRIFLVLLTLAVLAGGLAPSQEAPAASNDSTASPVGRWKTIDDRTGKPRGIVDLREENGKLYGTVESLFDPPVPNPTCYLCSGDLKDHPVVGMQVLWGLQKDSNQWTGGQVLDPETGKSYRASIVLEDGGKKLRLRGYILMPMFGRTQHWIRVE